MQQFDGDDSGLWPVLRQAALIRCDDGQYRKGSEIYFASPMLDVVISSSYRRLHPSYGVPVAGATDEEQTPYKSNKWYWLFTRLGINEHPIPDDLYHAIERLVSSGPPDEKRAKSVERIYDFLYNKSRERAYFENSKLKLLPNLEWLAAKNDNLRWHQPCKIFRPGDAELIGDQAPVLRFNEPTIELRAFLGIPERPLAGLIASHLFECARQRKEISHSVYRDLGRRWAELDSPTQKRLCEEAVVWDTHGRYWKGKQVFFQSHTRLFGSRRCYLDHKSADIQKFLLTIGAKANPHQIDDSIALLKEVAADYLSDQTVKGEDLRLIHKNFEHLGRLEKIEDALNLRELRALRIIPGRDDRLYPPSRVTIETQKNLLDQFDPGTIPVVKDETINEPIKRFLRIIGVRFLNEVVHRRLAEATDKREDARLKLHIRQLTPSFKRIAHHLREQHGDFSLSEFPIERLQKVEIYSCSRLVIHYLLNDGNGWEVSGYSREENALYDAEYNRLFVKRCATGEQDVLDLALELDRLLFPTIKKSEAIENLLRLRLTEVDAYLDRHGYIPLFIDQIEYVDEEAAAGNLISIPALPEPPPPTETKHTNRYEIPLSDIGNSAGNEEHTSTSATKHLSAISNIKTDDLTQDRLTKEVKAIGSPLTDVQPTEKSSLHNEDDEAQVAIPRSPKQLKPPSGIAGRTSQNNLNKNTDDDMPAFSGQVNGMSPILSNDYRELHKRFGLSRFGNSNQESPDSKEGANERLEDDWSLSDERWKLESNDTKEIREVRFTLRYNEWADGYLRLHVRARQMLTQLGSPTRLTCQMMYAEQTFELFVDYNEGVIYTRGTELIDIFQAHNIPAGGIIYFEHIHGVTLRLFWRPALSHLTDVMLLLLHEDGTLEKTVIPAAEFPCEVSEYVLRAEKRFEDGDALFAQAIGKHGIFQTICNIFGQAGIERSYDEIFNAMMQEHRWVSADSIRFELARRPCFVHVGNDCWRFDPHNGWQSTDDAVAGQNGLNGNAKRRVQKRSSQTSNGPVHQDSNTPSRLIAEANEHAPLLDLARSEWQALQYKIFQANENNTNEILLKFIEGIRHLASRLERELQAQRQPENEDDGLLQALWLKIESDPHNKTIKGDLATYLLSTDCNEVLSKLRPQLDDTAAELCDLLYFPLLAQIAHRALNEERIEIAASLYNLLFEKEAGDFSDEFTKIEHYNQIKEYIELSKITQSPKERWQLWQKAWGKYQGYSLLRQAIQDDFRAAVDYLGSRVTFHLEMEDANRAFLECLDFVACVNLVVDSWKTNQTVKGAWQIIRRVFAALIKNARTLDGDIGVYKQALETGAMLPPDEQKHLSADDYLEAIEAVAEDYRNRSNTTAAIALVDYGLRLVEHNAQIVREPIKIKLREYASKLCAEQGRFEQAYTFLKSIRPDSVSPEKARLLSNRLYELHKKLDSKAMSESNRLWRTQLESLILNTEFYPLINESAFRRLML